MPMLVKEENSSTARIARIGLRATRQQQMLIQRAAEASNKSITEFVLESACTAAESTILDQSFFLLEEEEWQKFHEILDRPAEVKTGLREMLQEQAPWE